MALFQETKSNFFGSLRFCTTNEMVPALVKSAKEGDETSKYQLFWHYYKVVYKLCYKYYRMCNCTVTLDDFVFFCYTEALEKAVQGYSQGSKAQFITYFWFKVRKACQKLYNSCSKIREMPDYYSPIYTDDNSLQWQDLISFEHLDELIKKHTKSQKSYSYVKSLFDGEGLDIHEVAETYGTTASAVSRLFTSFLQEVQHEESFAQYRA